MNLLDNLNEQQRQAVVFCDGPQMIIAGAGSGKTRVLTHKIAYLTYLGYKPEKILALTFTNKAANEMKQRTEKLLNRSLNSLWIGTFHSIFAKILRKEAYLLGYSSTYSIIDTDDAKAIIKKIVKEQKLNEDNYPPAKVYHRISRAKNSLILPEEYENDVRIQEYDQIVKMPEIASIYKYYQKFLKESNSMDFDDLLINMFLILNNFPEIAAKYQNFFHYILVDEYQDTNKVQYLIIKKLSEAHRKIAVVGDDSQSIYAFRGAQIENIFQFKRDFPDFKLFKLEINYRSTKNIVNAANSLIEINKNRIPKTIVTNNEEGDKVVVKELYDEVAEADFVSKVILNYTQIHKIPYDEIAVLYRTNSQSINFEKVFTNYRIPYRIYGSISFYQRQEIKDVLAYLKLIVNRDDNIALRRIINYPSRRIGDETILKIERLSQLNNVSFWDICTKIRLYSQFFQSNTVAAVENFVYLINELDNLRNSMVLSEFINLLVLRTGIKQEIEDKEENTEEKLQNIEELINQAATYVMQKINQNEEPSLEDFLQQSALLTDQDVDNKEKRTVKLMTCHAAKGLEFDLVFVTGLEKNIFPSSQVLTPEDEEEERRLMYVAMTRAKKFLFLTYCRERKIWGTINIQMPSKFLKEISQEYLTSEISRKNTLKTHNQENLKKLETINSVNFENQVYKIGQKVLHKTFGIGTILEIEQVELNVLLKVDFEKQGIKKLLAKFAKLEIIES